MTNGISVEEARRMGLLPKKAAPLAPMDAVQLAKAGSVAAAIRIRDAEEAKAKRENALKRTHCDKAELRIIGKPPSLNQFMYGVKARQMSAKSEYAELVREAWERAGKPVLRSPYKWRIHLIRASKRGDRSNFVGGAHKAILDLLTDVGAVGGDSYEHDHEDGPNTQELSNHWMVVFTIESISKDGQF